MTAEYARQTAVAFIAEIDNVLHRFDNESSLAEFLCEMNAGTRPPEFGLCNRDWLLWSRLEVQRLEYALIYPQLGQLLRAAFHYDWTFDCHTWEEYIDEMTSSSLDHSRHSDANRRNELERWARLIAEIDDVLLRFSDESKLAVFFREMDSGVLPPDYGLRYGDWLQEIRERFNKTAQTLTEKHGKRS